MKNEICFGLEFSSSFLSTLFCCVLFLVFLLLFSFIFFPLSPFLRWFYFKLSSLASPAFCFDGAILIITFWDHSINSNHAYKISERFRSATLNSISFFLLSCKSVLSLFWLQRCRSLAVRCNSNHNSMFKSQRNRFGFQRMYVEYVVSLRIVWNSISYLMCVVRLWIVHSMRNIGTASCNRTNSCILNTSFGVLSIQSKEKKKQKMRLAHKISTQSSERNCLIEPVAEVIKRKTVRDIRMRSIHDEMLDLGSFIYIMFPFEIL